MSRWSGLLLAALIALGAAPARAADGPERLPLRLVDLPPGYLVGDDSGCGLQLIGEGAPPELGGLRDYEHVGCGNQFERLWAPPGENASPWLVESVAIRFAAEEGAAAGLAAGRHVTAFVLGLRPGSLTPLAPITVGDEAVAFSTDDALVRGRGGRPGVAVIWRSGRVLSLVFTGGRAGPAAVQATLALAQAQEARVRAPMPLRPRDNDDRLVPLDNPELGIEVQWLGRRFRPPGNLPVLTLADSFGPLGPTAGPGWRADIDYFGRGAGVKLGLWRPRAFARFSRSRLGRLVRGQRCATVTRFEVPGGRAVVYARHNSPPRRCGARQPDRYLAHVILRGVVVTVNVPFCFRCLRREGDSGGAYDSLKGMRAVIEGLRARSARPTYIIGR